MSRAWIVRPGEALVRDFQRRDLRQWHERAGARARPSVEWCARSRSVCERWPRGRDYELVAAPRDSTGRHISHGAACTMLAMAASTQPARLRPGTPYCEPRVRGDETRAQVAAEPNAEALEARLRAAAPSDGWSVARRSAVDTGPSVSTCARARGNCSSRAPGGVALAPAAPPRERCFAPGRPSRATIAARRTGNADAHLGCRGRGDRLQVRLRAERPDARGRLCRARGDDSAGRGDLGQVPLGKYRCACTCSAQP